MGKAEGNNAWSTLRRLFKLVEYLASKGSVGASWDEIKQNIYFGESDAKDESLRTKFRKDQGRLMDIYNREEIYEDGEELPEEVALIEKKEDGRYTIRSGMTLMLPMSLREEEALALASSVRIVPGFIPLFEDASKRLWAKLQRHIRPELTESCDFLTEAIVPTIPMSRAGKNPYLMNVLDAISKKKVLNIRQYQSIRQGDTKHCQFSPWTLFLKYHSWYILGEIHEEKDTKIGALRVDRIMLAEVTDQDQPHPCDKKTLKQLQEDIRLDRYGHTDFPMPKNGWLVKLHITDGFVKPCMETEWFPGEKKKMLKDGSVDYEVTLKGLEAITLWIMRALECIEVLAPTELKKIIDKRVNQYLSRRDKQVN